MKFLSCLTDIMFSFLGERLTRNHSNHKVKLVLLFICSNVFRRNRVDYDWILLEILIKRTMGLHLIAKAFELKWYQSAYNQVVRSSILIAPILVIKIKLHYKI